MPSAAVDWPRGHHRSSSTFTSPLPLFSFLAGCRLMLLVTSPVDIKMFEKMIGLVFISLYTANRKLATDRRREPESSAGLVHFHSKHVYCPPNRKVYPVVLAPLLSQKKPYICISSGSSGGKQRPGFWLRNQWKETFEILSFKSHELALHSCSNGERVCFRKWEEVRSV